MDGHLAWAERLAAGMVEVVLMPLVPGGWRCCLWPLSEVYREDVIIIIIIIFVWACEVCVIIGEHLFVWLFGSEILNAFFFL